MTPSQQALLERFELARVQHPRGVADLLEVHGALRVPLARVELRPSFRAFGGPMFPVPALGATFAIAWRLDPERVTSPFPDGEVWLARVVESHPLPSGTRPAGCLFEILGKLDLKSPLPPLCPVPVAV